MNAEGLNKRPKAGRPNTSGGAHLVMTQYGLHRPSTTAPVQRNAFACVLNARNALEGATVPFMMSGVATTVPQPPCCWRDRHMTTQRLDERRNSPRRSRSLAWSISAGQLRRLMPAMVLSAASVWLPADLGWRAGDVVGNKITDRCR